MSDSTIIVAVLLFVAGLNGHTLLGAWLKRRHSTIQHERNLEVSRIAANHTEVSHRYEMARLETQRQVNREWIEAQREFRDEPWRRGGPS